MAVVALTGAMTADSTGAIWDGGFHSVTGTVRFEQAPDEPLGDVTMTYEISGLPANGTHAVHIHEFGDLSVTYNLRSMGAHFVPVCVHSGVGADGNAPAVTEATCANASTRPCECDQRHGMPPSAIRQPGDLGNLVSTGGIVSGTLVLGQEKLSLQAHPLYAILGRALVVHSLPDDGLQPYGNAGAPLAVGLVVAALPPSAPPPPPPPAPPPALPPSPPPLLSDTEIGLIAGLGALGLLVACGAAVFVAVWSVRAKPVPRAAPQQLVYYAQTPVSAPE